MLDVTMKGTRRAKEKRIRVLRCPVCERTFDRQRIRWVNCPKGSMMWYHECRYLDVLGRGLPCVEAVEFVPGRW